VQIEKGFTDNWLQPTGAQENLMRQYAGCKRFVWNRALSIEQAPARRRCASENIVKKRTGRRKLTDELRREDDLSKLKGVRSKSASRYQVGTNLVPLSPDVAKYFPHEQSVNMALRKLIHVTKVRKIS
jgi:hypothetical protein